MPFTDAFLKRFAVILLLLFVTQSWVMAAMPCPLMATSTPSCDTTEHGLSADNHHASKSMEKATNMQDCCAGMGSCFLHLYSPAVLTTPLLFAHLDNRLAHRHYSAAFASVFITALYRPPIG